MSAALVVDASIAAKWYLPEEDSETALAVLGSAAALHAPGLLKTELANAFWKHLRQGHVAQGLWPLARPRLERSIHQWHQTGAFLDEAFEIACAIDHPIYDCIYLSLARYVGSRLITADRRLLAKVQATDQASLVVALSDFRA